MKKITDPTEFLGVSPDEFINVNGRLELVVFSSLCGCGVGYDVRTIRRQGRHIELSLYDATSLTPFVTIKGVRNITNYLEKGQTLLDYDFYDEELRQRGK